MVQISSRTLPTHWNVFNLVGSPFFQESLEAGRITPRPLTLFIGREKELRRLLDGIHGAGDNSSRQAVAGDPGIGKTTLVKELKAAALEEGYLAADDFVSILATDTPDSLFGRILSALYDTILANRPQSGDNPAMRAAQILVRAARLGTGGASLAAFGFGVGATTGATIVAPRDILLDGPRVMRDLMQMVQGSDARGVLLHVNNLENLSESDAERAAVILRDLRDFMLLHSRLHYVFVGTTNALRTAVATHQQIRSVISIMVLDPLSVADVHRMLLVRYEHLRATETNPIIPPVDDDAVSTLYEFFRGDLRGLLKALEDGVTPLIGLESAAARPFTTADLRPVLQQRYTTELAVLAEGIRVEQLTQWGTQAPTVPQTQAELAQLWRVSQPAVSNALGYFVRHGYVRALARRGSDAIRYVLSGVSRLIFG
jgi:hypothetical protein